MQILNVDILSFHLIPKTKLLTTFEGSPKNMGFSAGSKTGYCEKKFTNINTHVNVLIMLQNKSKYKEKNAFIHCCFALVTRN
jgi:hypothetical protein